MILTNFWMSPEPTLPLPFTVKTSLCLPWASAFLKRTTPLPFLIAPLPSSFCLASPFFLTPTVSKTRTVALTFFAFSGLTLSVIAAALFDTFALSFGL